MKKLLLAPIKGITDYIFRNCLLIHFGGFDESIAPFFYLPSADNFDRSILKDVYPENQKTNVIPQIITKSPLQAKLIAQKLIEMGYKEVNLNFSCPFPAVTSKGRGSILMKNPELIRNIVRSINNLPISVSIKIRLGFDAYNQTQDLLNNLIDEDIKRVFLHARLATQLYLGTANIDKFKTVESSFPLIYNGDIDSVESFKRIDSALSNQDVFMIGRGALKNPFIFNEIKGKTTSFTNMRSTFRSFVQDLFEQYSLIDEHWALGKMKGLWRYFQENIIDDNFYKQIFKITEPNEMDILLMNVPDWKT